MVASVVFVAGMVVQRALNGHRYDTLQHDGIKMPSLHCNAGKKGASEIYRPKSYCAKQKMAKLGQGTFSRRLAKAKPRKRELCFAYGRPRVRHARLRPARPWLTLRDEDCQHP